MKNLHEARPAFFRACFQTKDRESIQSQTSTPNFMLDCCVPSSYLSNISKGETIVVGWSETGMCAGIMEMAAKDFTSQCAFNFQKACEKAPGT